MSYAFTFDASACSGCKACQEACKDKNGLPVGLMWRRVIEVAGGEWHRIGNAWDSSIFAYHLSLACNHCTHPKCAGVCPTDAFIVRQDGIVLIDSSRCMGCDYCTWACPYGAPQHDREHGIVTKCDFCYDRLDQGMPPSCVAACPLRVLNFETIDGLGTVDRRLNLWQAPGVEHPFPLPNYSRTEPHLAIKPHAGMSSPLTRTVANMEEIHPPGSIEWRISLLPAMHELPLVAFTLLTQMSVGLAVCSLAVTPLPLPLLLAIGISLAGGGLLSFLHLGRKRNAWRSVVHLKKSWLSREILIAGLFGITWAVTTGVLWFRGVPASPLPMAILGLGLLFCMSQVYRLRTVMAWNTWHTLVSFLLSALVMGALGINLIFLQPEWFILAALGMVAELAMIPAGRVATHEPMVRLRMAFLGLGILGALVMVILPQANIAWYSIPIFFIALAAEVLGRWQFYAERVPFPRLNIP